MSQSPVSLRTLADQRGLKIGVCVNNAYLHHTRRPEARAYLDVLAREFNIVTPENVLKFAHLCPKRGQYRWAEGDRFFEMAERFDQTVRIHTAVWHNTLPEWVKTPDHSGADLKRIMRDHLQAVADHYRGRFAYWDVVNEPITPRGPLYRDPVWGKNFGEEYIDLAFGFARKAAPGVCLVLNDFNVAWPNRKSQGLWRVVRDAKKRGAPIDAVGFQFHMFFKRLACEERIAETFRRFSDLGVEVHITEMDVAVRKLTGPWEHRLQRQAEYYARALRALLSCPTGRVFQTWGFTDNSSWVLNHAKGQPEAPLLFDTEYRPKPAYHAIHRVLESYQP